MTSPFIWTCALSEGYGYVEILEKDGAESIIILTDLDKDICITQTKERISARKQDIVIIAVKQIEAWFLASSIAMGKLLNQPDFHFTAPESEFNPFETINYPMVENTGRGVGKKTAGKIKLVSQLLDNNLDLYQTAGHPNCPSAKYFLSQLEKIGKI